MIKRLPFPKTDYFVSFYTIGALVVGWGPRNYDEMTVALLCDRETREPRWFGVSYRSHRDSPNERVGRVIALGRAIRASEGHVRQKFSPVPLYGPVDEGAPTYVRQEAGRVSQQAAAWRAKRAAGRAELNKEANQ